MTNANDSARQVRDILVGLSVFITSIGVSTGAISFAVWLTGAYSG